MLDPDADAAFSCGHAEKYFYAAYASFYRKWVLSIVIRGRLGHPLTSLFEQRCVQKDFVLKNGLKIVLILF